MDMVVAYDENRCIGKDGKIPWYIPDDLQWFKTITMGKTVVMGRKTFETMGKPLPNRTNIVLTRQQERLHKDIIQVDNPNFVIDYAKSFETVIIGGGEIYAMFMSLSRRVYATEIKTVVNGEILFPQLPDDFRLASTWKNLYSGGEVPLEYDIKVYLR
jgi:dihydrofolate reductase